MITNAVPSELQPLLHLMGGDQGWLIAVFMWMGAIRLPMKFINAYVQDLLTNGLHTIALSPETDDDDAVTYILTSKPYRLITFILDMFLSFKLPHNSDFMDLKAKQTKINQTIANP